MARRLAICIGVNKHKNQPSANLRFAVNDAKTIASVLRDKERGGFHNVVEILDGEVTKDNILAQLKQVFLQESLTKDDLVLIFFAGHGEIDGGEKFFAVTHDVDFLSNGKIDLMTTLRIQDLESLLDNTQAGSIIAIFDACHSGASGKLLGNLKYNDSSNIIFVGAARTSETARENPQFQHGIFTECLLRSINQPPSQGEWITFSQALAFIQTKMAKIGSRQTMEVSTHVINQNLLFSRNPLYSLINDNFTESVRELCELYHCSIVSTQPNLTLANTFIIKEQRSFNRSDYSLIVCFDNSQVQLSESNIEQFTKLFHQLQDDGEVTSAIVVTKKEITSLLKKIIEPPIDIQTIDEIKRTLMDFSRYLPQIINDFEKGDEERSISPSLKQCFVELDARVLQTNHSDKPQPITEIVNQWLGEENQTIAVILGGYGTGKTTFSRKIACDLAQKYCSSSEKAGLRIPILFPLRKFPKFSAADIEAFIIAHLKQSCKVKNPDFGAFQEMNEAGLFVLIFDGFDEMAVRADEDVIYRNYSEIVRLANFPNAKVIITSRPEACLTEKEAKEVFSQNDDLNFEYRLQIELCPFSEAKIEEYLQKRVPLIKKAVESGKSWKFYRDKINSIMGLKYLAERPVLLEMTVTTLPKLIEEGGAVTRPRLYEAYLNGEINRQTRNKKRDFLIKGKDFRLLLIQSIACDLYNGNSLEITAEEIKQVLKNKFNDFNQFDLEACVRDFIACSFMIREGNTFSFSHRSFIDYLVSKQLAEEIHSQKQGLITCLTSDEVISFLIEMTPNLDIKPFINWENLEDANFSRKTFVIKNKC